MAKFDVPAEKYHRIGEVAKILGVKTSVLRFWESQFPELHPKKTRTGQRLYSDSDIRLLKYIQRELKETGMTIEGLRKKMRTVDEGELDGSRDRMRRDLLEIRRQLEELLAMIRREQP